MTNDEKIQSSLDLDTCSSSTQTIFQEKITLALQLPQFNRITYIYL